jgi:hypothetical protein
MQILAEPWNSLRTQLVFHRLAAHTRHGCARRYWTIAFVVKPKVEIVTEKRRMFGRNLAVVQLAKQQSSYRCLDQRVGLVRFRYSAPTPGMKRYKLRFQGSVLTTFVLPAPALAALASITSAFSASSFSPPETGLPNGVLIACSS